MRRDEPPPDSQGGRHEDGAARVLRDIHHRRLGIVDRLQHPAGAIIEDAAVLGGLQLRVVRLNSRTPRCFSSSEIRAEATAGEVR